MATRSEPMVDGQREFDPGSALAQVTSATGHLLATAARLDDAALRQPSLLPGWTRGHVLTHVARNADGLINLLTWARTGVETHAYPSRTVRDAEIEAGAGRPVTAQLSDLRESAERFAAAVIDMPLDRWAALVRWNPRTERPARAILAARLREVEIHHVDLDADYTAAHWHTDFSGAVLDGVTVAMTEAGDVPARWLHALDTDRTWPLGNPGDESPQLSGPQAALLAWLIGRASGDGLLHHPHDSPLPVPPPWS